MTKYVLLVGGGYGGVVIDCIDAADAEEHRKHKARWEGAISKIRVATDDEAKTGIASQCWNHPLFENRFRYVCDCGQCDNVQEGEH
jgi:hypothetical protein